MSTVTTEGAVVDGVNKQLFIGGEWRDASGGGTFPVEDPSTAEALCEVADATPEDALAALAAASEAQAEWGAYPPRERGEIPSTTQTWTPPWRVLFSRRCATSERHAPLPTASTSQDQ
jgi:hypothetical protein